MKGGKTVEDFAIAGAATKAPKKMRKMRKPRK
jgi:hypothetical protein